jgi:uncharacterized protein
MLAYLLPGLVLGLAGSLHCVGMCSPLMLALPMDMASRRQVIGQLLTYHAGRILTYAALGLLFGLLGKGIAVAGFQQGLSIVAGILMLGMAVLSWRFERLVTALPGFAALSQWVKQTMNHLLRHQGGHLLLGALNGLLPCGMVYAALAGALATSEVAHGAFFMVLFGVGTLPLLLSVHLVGRKLNSNFLRKIRTAQPILLFLVGLLLIQRGAHLDLSLFESAVPKAGYDCH